MIKYSVIIATSLAFTSRVCQAAQDPVFTAITDSPISESYAFSAAWGDYDRDGIIDLLAVDFNVQGNGSVYLFRNQGGGAFDKATVNRSAYSHSGYIIGAIWGDYDNDGRPDILVSSGGLWCCDTPNILLHQQTDGTFTRSASPSFPSGISQSALFGDFDNDGRLDIFAGYWTDSFPTPAVTDRLFRNNEHGTFTDTKASGINRLNNNEDSAMAATAGDFNGDGLTDIIVTTIIPQKSRLYVNQGGLKFERKLVTPSAPRADYANGIAVADYDNDGDLDFVTVSKSGSYSWTCACDGGAAGLTKLWRNDGAGEFEEVVAGDLGNDEIIGANAAAWADFNNDGWLDVALFRGIYSNGRGQDPADVLYRNNGDGSFTRVTTGPIVNEDGDARAGAWGDMDNDGDMDLVVANYTWPLGSAGSNRRPVLYRNEGNDHHWLKLSLRGTDSNADAFGAKVRLKAKIKGQEVWQLRELHSNTGWIPSQNDVRPHFGLGDATVVEVVRIEWPSGIVQELTDVAADQILHIIEPPRLRIESGGRLSWPASAEMFRLDSAPSVNGPWSPATETFTTNAARMTVKVETDGPGRFYRLSLTGRWW